MNSIKGTIFMNSENNKAYYPDWILLNLSDKIERNDKHVSLSNLIYCPWKKKSNKNIKFKVLAPTRN